MGNNQTINFIDLLKTLQVKKVPDSFPGWTDDIYTSIRGGYADDYYVFCGPDRPLIVYSIHDFYGHTGAEPCDRYSGHDYEQSIDETEQASKLLEYKLTCNIIKEKIRNTPIDSEDLYVLGEKKTALLKYKDYNFDGFNYQNFVSYEEMIGEIENVITYHKQYVSNLEKQEARKEQKRLKREKQEEQRRLKKEKADEIKQQVKQTITAPLKKAYSYYKSTKEELKRKSQIKDTRDL